MRITKDCNELEECCRILKTIFLEFKYTPNDLENNEFVVFIDDDTKSYFILHLTYDYIILAYSYVPIECRGKGYGKSLTKQVVDYAKKYSRPIKITVRLTNIPSYKIALDVGFIPQSTFIKKETTWVILIQ